MRTPEHSYLGPRDVRPLVLSREQVTAQIVPELHRLGINVDSLDIDTLMTRAQTGDSLLGLQTTASITTPVQFLQAWLPGFVQNLTQVRKIDTLVGIVTAGSWEDEEVVQGVLELASKAVPYTDGGNIPLSSWNVNFERRSIVRFEDGISVGRLEEARASKIRVNSADSKRNAASLSLDISRNRIGFYGYQSGDNRTYGFLNDPALPAYVNVAANGSGDTEWSNKDFLEITSDIIEAVSSLLTQSGGNIDATSADTTLAVSLSAMPYLSITNNLGTTSVKDWISATYPRMRVESAPELDAANGGDNVFILYAETVDDLSTDDRRSIVQVVPARFMTLGVEQRAKAYLEDYTNATAGCMVKRPYAFVRRSGI